MTAETALTESLEFFKKLRLGAEKNLALALARGQVVEVANIAKKIRCYETSIQLIEGALKND